MSSPEEQKKEASSVTVTAQSSGWRSSRPKVGLSVAVGGATGSPSTSTSGVPFSIPQSGERPPALQMPSLSGQMGGRPLVDGLVDLSAPPSGLEPPDVKDIHPTPVTKITVTVDGQEMSFYFGAHFTQGKDTRYKWNYSQTQRLESYGVTYGFNCTGVEGMGVSHLTAVCEKFNIYDLMQGTPAEIKQKEGDEEALFKKFNEIIDAICASTRNGNPVYIYCHVGQERSTTVTIGCLMAVGAYSGSAEDVSVATDLLQRSARASLVQTVRIPGLRVRIHPDQIFLQQWYDWRQQQAQQVQTTTTTTTMAVVPALEITPPSEEAAPALQLAGDQAVVPSSPSSSRGLTMYLQVPSSSRGEKGVLTQRPPVSTEQSQSQHEQEDVQSVPTFGCGNSGST